MKKEKEITQEIEHSSTYKHQALQDIENSRDKFLSTYRRQNTLKWVISLICIAAIVVAFIVIPNVITENEKLKSGLMIGIAVVALAGTFGYSVFTKRSMNKKMRNYFSVYYRKVAEFTFDQKGFTNAVVQEPGKISLEQFNESCLYKNIVDVGSRGLTEFEYNEMPMAIVDCAGNVKTDKRLAPVFVGKLLFAATSYLEKEPIVIYIKGNEKSLPPTNLDSMKKVHESEQFDIYSNNKNWKKVITAPILKQIEGIKPNAVLVDLAISMLDGRIFVAFGYDDPLMILPLQQQFDSKPTEIYKKDIAKLAVLVEALNK